MTTTAAVTVRRATPADTPDVAAMVREIAAYEDRSAHVHMDDDLWTGDAVLDLDDLSVRPGNRDGGVGRQLMSALAGLAAADQLLIRWGMEADNDDARRFYRRLGATLRPTVLAAWTPDAYGDFS